MFLDVLMGKKWIHNCYDMMKWSWFFDYLGYLWSFINVFMFKGINISSIFPKQVLSQKDFHYWHPLLTLEHSLKNDKGRIDVRICSLTWSLCSSSMALELDSEVLICLRLLYSWFFQSNNLMNEYRKDSIIKRTCA